MRNRILTSLNQSGKKTKIEYKITQQNSGPAYFDPWRLREGRVDCWQQKESIVIENKKKKMILSNALLNHYAITEDEIKLLSILIEEFELYIWENKPLNRPIDTLDELLASRAKIYPATKEAIIDEFNKQGVATSEDYIFLDVPLYKQLLAEINNKPSSKEILSFHSINIKENQPMLAKLLPAYGIKHISLLTPDADELAFLLELMPQIETIEIGLTSTEWLIKNENLFKGRNVILHRFTPNQLQSFSYTLAMGHIKSLTLDSNTHMTTLTLDKNNYAEEINFNSKYISKLECQKNATIKKFTMKVGTHLHELDFRNLEALEVLNLDCSSMYKLQGNLGVPKDLKNLTIINPVMKDLDLRHLTQLESLTLKQGSISLNIHLAHNSKLRSLYWENCKLANIPWNNLLNIEELTLDGTFSEHFDNPTLSTIALPSLKRLKFNSPFPKIVFDRFPNLESLSISSYCILELVNIPTTVKALSINATLSSLDFTALTSLDSLELRSLPNINLSELKLPKNIKKLTITGFRKISGTISLDQFPQLEELEILSGTDIDLTPHIQNIPRSIKKTTMLSSNTELSRAFIQLEDLQKSLIGESKNKTTTAMEGNFQVNDTGDLEMESVSNLKFLGSDFNKNLNLSIFPNLDQLILDYCEVKEGFKLVSTSVTDVAIKKTNLSANFIHYDSLPNLENLTIKNSDNIEVLNVMYHPNLKTLTIIDEIGNKSKILDLSGFPNLESLTISDFHDLETLKLPLPNKIKDIVINTCYYLKHFDLAQCQELESFQLAGGKQLTYYNMKNLKNLRTVTIDVEPHENTNLGPFIVDCSSCAQLQSLRVDVSQRNHPSHTTIKAENCSQLKQFLVTTDTPNTVLPNLSKSQNLKIVGITTPSENHFKLISAQTLPKQCLLDFNLILYTNSLQQQNLNQPPKNEVSLADKLLDQKNTESTVSVWTYKNNLTVDKKTGVVTTMKTIGNYKTSLFTKKAEYQDEHRIQILDHIDYKKGKLNFCEAQPKIDQLIRVEPIKRKINSALLKEMKDKSASMDGTGAGCLEAELKKGIFYPLVAPGVFQKENFNYYVDPEGSVSVYWNHDKQQYLAALNEKAGKQKKIKVLYDFNYDHEYDHLPSTQQNVLITQHPLLDQELSVYIKAKLTGIKDLEFLFDEKLSPEVKFTHIIDYLDHKFNDGELKEKVESDIDILLAEIKERKGVCRHVSEAFMLLSHFINIPVRININARHAFVEIPYLGKGQIAWKKLDLGGGDPIDLTPVESKINVFDKVGSTQIPKLSMNIPTQTTTPPVKAHTPQAQMQVKTESEARKLYREKLKELIDEQLITDTSEFVSSKHKSAQPLIVLSKNQTVRDINRQLITAYGKGNDTYLYIDTPEDFTQYLHPRVLENGKYKTILGPIHNLNQTGGVIVVNWSNFTPTQLASYKSILDTEPTLLGEKISKNIKIIGIADENIESCSAFSSRVKRYRMESVLPTEKNTLQSEITTEPIKLFNSSAWRVRLFGDDEVIDNKLVLVEGNLIKAIKENKPIIIFDPPNDPSFNLLLDRIRDEGKIFYNDSFITIPEGFRIEIQKKENPIQLDNVVLSNQQINENSNRIYLGLYNLHECFKRMQVIDRNRITIPGLLETYNDNQDVFYITESLPRSEWEQIIDFIKNDKTLSHKNFHFILAPHVSIEGVKTTNATEISPKVEKDIPYIAHVFTTNDTDLLTSTIAAKEHKPLIIDATPGTSFSDLIYKVKMENVEETNTVDFSIEIKDALCALKEGRTVIINGRLSANCYQQLLPILNGERSIEVNGEKIKITGKLIAVMPEEIKQAYQVQSESEHYDFNDYKKILLSKSSPDEAHQVREHLNKIELFYALANKLPHRGLGRPIKPRLSYKRIANFLEALKEPHPYHRSNPIKGLFLYDYPRYSEDYAYLNVMAKYVFKRDAEAGYRHHKLEQMHKRFDLSSFETFKDHSWAVLNCFNSAMLYNFFKDNLESTLVTENGFPKLNEQQLKELYHFTQSLLLKQNFHNKEIIEIQKSPNSEKKLAEYLHSVLNNQKSNLVILKGGAGVGKTHAIRKVLEKVYEGEAGIAECLAQDSKEMKYILLDEGNTVNDTTWDFFKGVLRGNEGVYYKDKLYSAKNIKIISTINPEDFPNRKYQSLFQDYGETIYLQKPSDETLKSTILAPILKKDPKFAEHSELIIAAYHLITDYNPYLPTSIRDIEDVAQRYLTLIQDRPYATPEDFKLLLFKACISEFAGSIKEVEIRKKFINHLKAIFNLPNFNENTTQGLIKITDEYSLPQEKAYVFDAIEENLKTRDRYIASFASKTSEDAPEQFYYKSAILLEGESGLGKSKIFKMAIEKKRLEMVAELLKHADPNENNESSDTFKKAYVQACKKWDYLEVTAGSSEISAKLKEAFHQGKIIILDELNLADERTLAEINQYTTGFDLDGKPAEIPGCVFYTSENFASDAGRKSLGPQMRNRTHFIYMDKYTDSELIKVASQYLQHTEDLVYVFREAEQLNPYVNTRTFFYALESLRHLPILFSSNNQSIVSDSVDPIKKLDVSLQSSQQNKEQIIIGEKQFNRYFKFMHPKLSKEQEQAYIKEASAFKHEILSYILSFKKEQKIGLLKEALDPTTYMGKLFWHQNSLFPTSTSRGTLKIIKAELARLEKAETSKLSKH